MAYQDKRILMVEDRYSDMDTDVIGPFATFGEAKAAALDILDRCTRSDLMRRTGGRQIVVCEYDRVPDEDDEGGCPLIDELIDVVEESGRLSAKSRRERAREWVGDDDEDEEDWED